MNRTRHDLRSHHHTDVMERLKTGLFGACLVMFMYGAVMFIPPSLFTYLISLPPVVIVLITCVARINDLGIEMASNTWNVRRAGLVLVALFACGVAVWPMLYGTWTPWLLVFGIWGKALTWLTTPHQPPWRRFAFGSYNRPAVKHPHRRREDNFDGNP